MWKFLTLTVVLSISFSLSAEVKKEEVQKELSQVTVKAPLINEIVTVTPIENHHFNLEAPQSCGKGETMESSARKINCQFHSAGEKEILVSVCDNQKKYCKQDVIKVTVVDQTSKTPRLKMPAGEQTQTMHKNMKEKLMDGFVEITPKKLKSSLAKKKGALVLVSTDWCPPCNVVKEFLLPTESFKAATKDLLLIYVDGDSPSFSEWKPVLKTFFYPSFIVLDNKGERVDLITGYNYFFEFDNWLAKAKEHMNNTLVDLEKRMSERLAGSTFQKIKDMFVSTASIKEDRQRWVKYLEKTSQQQEALKYLEAWNDPDFQFKKSYLQYADLWFGKKSSEVSVEEREEGMNSLVKQMLTTFRPTDLSQESIVAHLISEKCAKDETKQSKKKEGPISQEQCDKLIKQMAKDQQRSYKEIQGELLESEKLIAEATLYKDIARISETQGLKTLAKQGFQKCAELWTSLKSFSPLGEKSRSARIQSLSCLRTVDSFDKLQSIQSLISDFPYDATFHGYLASYYLEQKQFDKALKANRKAIQYSYGDSWAKNLIKRVTILKAKGEKKLALQTIEDSLKEISLEKDNKKQWWLNDLRAQQKELNQDLKL